MKLEVSKEVSQEKYDKIMSILAEEKGMWKPVERALFYYVSVDGAVIETKYEDDTEDKNIISIGNFYQTEAEALAQVEWLKAVQRIKEYIAREFENYIPENWTDYHIICFDGALMDFHCTNTYLYSPFGYLRSSEDAEQLIKDCQADLLIVFKV